MPRLRRSSFDPAHVYVGLQGAWAFLWSLAFTLSLVYQVDVVGLSPLQLIIVGTVLEATCFLAEIPTGVVADLRSRKWSVIIGLALVGAGITLMAGGTFWTIVAAQVVWGIGYTFVSGAGEAWVTDEVGAESVHPVFTRGHQVSLGLTILGILAAGLLGQVALVVPIVAGGAGFIVLACVMSVIMREENFVLTRAQDRDTWSRMWSITREGVGAANRPGVIRTFMVVGFLSGLSSEVFDRLWVDRVIHDVGLPGLSQADDVATWFTIFAVASALLGLLSSLAVSRLAPAALSAEHPTRIMAGLVLVQVAGVAVFAVAGNVWVAMGGKWTRDAAQAVSWPIAHAWLNRHIANPGSRATTLSMMGQADAVGQIVGGPSLGLVANRAGVQTALLIASAIQVPAAVLYARLRPRDGS